MIFGANGKAGKARFSCTAPGMRAWYKRENGAFHDEMEGAMVSDADLQVWLDSQPALHRVVLIPFVRSAESMQLGFRLDIVQAGPHGISRISQRGSVVAPAQTPTALGSSMTIDTQESVTCHVEIGLHRDAEAIGTYRFPCFGTDRRGD